jgi:hypothetical protein
VLIAGILLMPMISASSVIYQPVVHFISNRWVHFLVYMSVAAIPVAAWRRKTNVLLSLVLVVLCVALKLLQGHTTVPMVRYQSFIANMFGVAAGILLGFNIRMLHASKADEPTVTPSETVRSN